MRENVQQKLGGFSYSRFLHRRLELVSLCAGCGVCLTVGPAVVIEVELMLDILCSGRVSKTLSKCLHTEILKLQN